MEHWIMFTNYDGEMGERWVSFSFVHNKMRIEYGSFSVIVNGLNSVENITWNGDEIDVYDYY